MQEYNYKDISLSYFLLINIFDIRVGGSIPVIFSYFTEFQPKDRRGKMISALATFWMFGNIIAAGKNTEYYDASYLLCIHHG